MRAVIFDLDNCIMAADEAGVNFFDSAFAAIAEANKARGAQAIPPEILQTAFVECWFTAFDAVAEKYQFSQEMIQAGWAEFSQLKINCPIFGYGDLDALAEINLPKFLVTSGFAALQNSKIDALGFSHFMPQHPKRAKYFTEIVIDTIDRPPNLGKERIFRNIMEKYTLNAQDILVVGDNPVSEIAAGNRLGMTTVQISRPKVIVSDQAQHQLRDFHELVRFIEVG